MTSLIRCAYLGSKIHVYRWGYSRTRVEKHCIRRAFVGSIRRLRTLPFESCGQSMFKASNHFGLSQITLQWDVHTRARLSIQQTIGHIWNLIWQWSWFLSPIDYCSTLKITDQSNQKVGCTIFCDKLEEHPKIFKMGDIIRLHRVKVNVWSAGSLSVKSFGPATGRSLDRIPELTRWTICQCTLEQGT